MPAHIIGYTLPKHYTFIHSFNMTKFFQSLFSNTTSYVPSTAVRSLYVDPIRGTATAMYIKDDMNNGIYKYTNVSRRAIIKFMLDDARSLGKFVNVVLKQPRVACTSDVLTLA